MTAILVGLVLTVGTVAIIEGYLIFGRMQLLLNHAEKLLNAGSTLLAAVPSKSADRTDGIDAKPQTWWQNLRNLPAVEVEPDPALQQACEKLQDAVANLEPVTFEPDPNPSTAPIVMPQLPADTVPDMRQASSVAPLPALSDDEWHARQIADHEQWKREQEERWGVAR